MCTPCRGRAQGFVWSVWSNSVPYLEVRILNPQGEESALQREACRERMSVITLAGHVRRQIQHKPCLPLSLE